MNRRRILIDAGNSFLKWVVVEDREWRAQGSSDYADWSELEDELDAGTACFIASVTRAENERQLAMRLEAKGVATTWLTAEAVFDDVKNAYVNPKQLGVDRWMSLVAARQRSNAPTLVVSVGTAMTVDALSADGVFLGGVIVPGMNLMREALVRGTARVTEATGHWQAFPRCTTDAVESGIVAALCGAVQLQHARLAEISPVAPQCLLTGGAAKALSPHLTVAAEFVPALVMEGIDRVSRKRMCE